MKISIIVPTYNRPELLRRALKSIAEQTYQDYEVVVINDRGCDVGYLIGDHIEISKIKYIENGINLGLSKSLNIGLKEATGELIAYLDDDDIYYPRHLEILCEALVRNDCNFVYSNFLKTTVDHETGKVISKSVMPDNDYDQSKLLQKNLMATNCVMHRKSCLDTAGYFNEDLSVLMDWELWLRMSEHYELVHVDEITCEVFIKNDQSNMSSNRIAMIATYHNIRDKFLKKMEKTHKNDYRLNTALTAYDEYDGADTFLRNHFEAIKKKGVKRAAIFGASSSGKLYLNYLINAGVEIPVIFDNDIEKQGEKLNGVLIQDPETINDYDLDAVVIASRGHKREIIKQIKSIVNNDLMIIKD